MNIEAFLLCDAATDQQGKLNILGSFEAIYPNKMPASYPACTIAARIRFEKIEEGDHPFRIDIIDTDGKSIGPKLDGGISVRVREGSDSTVTNFIVNLQRLRLENYGQYRIDLAIDGQIAASLPFYVRQPPNQA